MFDIKKAQEEATKEFLDEKQKHAKERIKDKLKLLDKAELVVKNLRRELDDLYVELGQSL